jgi:hypothetical protein
MLLSRASAQQREPSWLKTLYNNGKGCLYEYPLLITRIPQVLDRARGGRIFARVDAAAHTLVVVTCYRFTIMSNAR